MRHFVQIYWLIFILSLSSMTTASVVNTGQVEAELVSEVKTIRPAQPFWVALRLKMAPHWHVYWINPGDAGQAPSVEWTLPEGFQTGEIQWPYPKRVWMDEFVNFGYEDEVLLMVQITPPNNLDPEQVVELKAAADWLVCKDVCIPESGEVSLTLTVQDGPPETDPQWLKAFAETRSRLPLTQSDWQIEAAVEDTSLVIVATPPTWFSGTLSKTIFFPYEEFLIHNAAEQGFEKTGGSYRIMVPLAVAKADLPEKMAGILVTDSGWRGEGSEKALEIDVPVATKLSAASGAQSGNGLKSLLLALGFAFMGGIILNLMPCVLPVLSLKILSFVQQAGEDRKKVFHHGLMFTFGVLASFWVLAGALLLLRAGGEQLGWGFQLQSPSFIVFLAVFLFLFGLSLFGVFEIGTSLMGVGQNVPAKSGGFGSFMSGVTATVVATPCTAPFMGSALGFALSQPALVAMLIFTSLGMGMAAPYVVLASSPALMRFVPKPGLWMESLKQFMGFLLMATVIWLAWVLGNQAGVNAVVLLLFVLLFVSVGGWILGRWGSPVKEKHTRLTAQVGAALLILVPLYLFIANLDLFAVTPSANGNPAAAKSAEGIAWQPFSPQLVQDLRSEGKPVFIDFTASWCLSCQVNKKVAFGSEDVQKAFSRLGVNALIADWTSRDETITRALAEFGRNSVPLYVLYSSDPNREPIILPELITPGIVLDALKEIE